jgi:hypothetical protein
MPVILVSKKIIIGKNRKPRRRMAQGVADPKKSLDLL